jgi:hypothetical protein
MTNVTLNRRPTRTRTVYVNRGGLSALSILGIIFVLCKVFGVAPIAGWAWWQVLIPFYIGIVVSFGLLTLFGLLMAAFAAGCAACIFGYYGIVALWQKVFPTKAQRELRDFRLRRNR